MKEERDYIRDIAEIRTMMERSSKFLSLSGWAGIMAGIYALAGAYIAYKIYDFHPKEMAYSSIDSGGIDPNLVKIFFLALIIFLLAIGTAIFFSYKRSSKRGEKLWNATSKRLLTSMAVPLIVGGILILILVTKGMVGLMAPFTLIFYGLALYNASKFTLEEVKFLGLVQTALGLVSVYYVEYGILFWAIGFGFVHIIYGVYMHYRYER